MPICMAAGCQSRCAFVPALRCTGTLSRRHYAAAMPVLDVAGSLGIANALQPLADVLNIITPTPVTKFSHPAAMAAVLLALGGQATYFGWQLRLSNNPDTIVAAKEQHPKLARALTLSFTFGAIGGLISLVMQGKPLFQSPHAITGIVGLVLLYLQGTLTLFFEDDPAARSIHALFGIAIMAFFVLHMTFGINLALSL